LSPVKSDRCSGAPEIDCIEYRKLKSQATTAESTRWHLFVQPLFCRLLGLSFPTIAATAVDPIEFAFAVASAVAREIKRPHAPPPPATGTAPKRM
jgi:hypothetical protein